MAETASDSKNAWTDAARFQFLLRIVAQLQRGGGSIKWNEINMPGRTPKSLMHQWTKIKQLVADLEKGDDAATTTPAKGKGGAKRKAAPLTPEATPEKKRQRTKLPDARQVKKEEDDSDSASAKQEQDDSEPVSA